MRNFDECLYQESGIAPWHDGKIDEVREGTRLEKPIRYQRC